jgi:hypothetical protein
MNRLRKHNCDGLETVQENATASKRNIRFHAITPSIFGPSGGHVLFFDNIPLLA